jgi:hypothetical protein
MRRGFHITQPQQTSSQSSSRSSSGYTQEEMAKEKIKNIFLKFTDEPTLENKTILTKYVTEAKPEDYQGVAYAFNSLSLLPTTGYVKLLLCNDRKTCGFDESNYLTTDKIDEKLKIYLEIYDYFEKRGLGVPRIRDLNKQLTIIIIWLYFINNTNYNKIANSENFDSITSVTLDNDEDNDTKNNRTIGYLNSIKNVMDLLDKRYKKRNYFVGMGDLNKLMRRISAYLEHMINQLKMNKEYTPDSDIYNTIVTTVSGGNKRKFTRKCKGTFTRKNKSKFTRKSKGKFNKKRNSYKRTK